MPLVKTDYDLMEELGSWTPDGTSEEIFVPIHKKIRLGEPLTQMEAAWLACKAGLLVCDCRPCVKLREIRKK